MSVYTTYASVAFYSERSAPSICHVQLEAFVYSSIFESDNMCANVNRYYSISFLLLKFSARSKLFAWNRNRKLCSSCTDSPLPFYWCRRRRRRRLLILRSIREMSCSNRKDITFHEHRHTHANTPAIRNTPNDNWLNEASDFILSVCWRWIGKFTIWNIFCSFIHHSCATSTSLRSLLEPNSRRVSRMCEWVSWQHCWRVEVFTQTRAHTHTRVMALWYVYEFCFVFGKELIYFQLTYLLKPNLQSRKVLVFAASGKFHPVLSRWSLAER